MKMIKLAKERIWTSTELHSLYLDKGGKDLNRTRLLNKVTEYMGNEVVALLSPGVASIIMMNEKASQILKFKRVDKEDNDINLSLITKKINSEVKRLSRNNDVYKNLTKELFFDHTRSIILCLLDLIYLFWINKLLVPIMAPNDTKTAPEEFLKRIRCNWKDKLWTFFQHATLIVSK